MVWFFYFPSTPNCRVGARNKAAASGTVHGIELDGELKRTAAGNRLMQQRLWPQEPTPRDGAATGPHAGSRGYLAGRRRTRLPEDALPAPLLGPAGLALALSALRPRAGQLARAGRAGPKAAPAAAIPAAPLPRLLLLLLPGGPVRKTCLDMAGKPQTTLRPLPLPPRRGCREHPAAPHRPLAPALPGGPARPGAAALCRSSAAGAARPQALSRRCVAWRRLRS